MLHTALSWKCLIITCATIYRNTINDTECFVTYTGAPKIAH